MLDSLNSELSGNARKILVMLLLGEKSESEEVSPDIRVVPPSECSIYNSVIRRVSTMPRAPVVCVCARAHTHTTHTHVYPVQSAPLFFRWCAFRFSSDLFPRNPFFYCRILEFLGSGKEWEERAESRRHEQTSHNSQDAFIRFQRC